MKRQAVYQNLMEIIYRVHTRAKHCKMSQLKGKHCRFYKFLQLAQDNAGVFGLNLSFAFFCLKVVTSKNLNGEMKKKLELSCQQQRHFLMNVIGSHLLIQGVSYFTSPYNLWQHWLSSFKLVLKTPQLRSYQKIYWLYKNIKGLEV